MPNSAMDNLSKDSNDKQIQDAISSEIEMCMHTPGMTQQQCAGKAYGMARAKTGKELK